MAKPIKRSVWAINFLTIFLFLLAFAQQSWARPTTPTESSFLSKLEALAAEVMAENNRDTQLPDDIRKLKLDIEGEIAAVPSGSSDSPELMAALWAFTTWDADPGKYAYTASLKSPLPIHDLGNDSLKCNRFVADAFGIGACMGFATDGARGKYPVGKRLRLFWNGYPPSANELGNRTKILANLYIVPPGDPVRLGYIIAFPQEGTGHSGIYLGRGLYISARDDILDTRPGLKIQKKDGVQITRILEKNQDDTPKERVFRKFAYGFDFQFSFANKVVSRRFYIPNSYFKVTLEANYPGGSIPTGATTEYIVSLHSVDDGDHSECRFTVGSKQYCQWKKARRGVYYMEIYKIGSKTTDKLEGTGETTIP